MITTVILLNIYTAAGFAEESLFSRFSRLAAVPSISGHEETMINYIRSKLPSDSDWQISSDNMGSLYMKWGDGDADIVVLTSIDEAGYVVSAINSNGYLSVRMTARPVSTLFHQFHEGQKVDIATQNTIVPGVVSIPSSHISRGKTDLMDLFSFLIDIGARTQQEVMDRGVQILDPIWLTKSMARLPGNRLSGPALSRKFGAQALLEVITSLKPELHSSILFVWASKGFQRNSGVQRLANRVRLNRVILVQPFVPSRNRRTNKVTLPAQELGGGILVAASDNPVSVNNTFYQRALAVLQSKTMKFTPSSTGQLSEIRSLQASGAKIFPLSIPIKYPGSLVEVIDLDDLEALTISIQAILDL